MASTMETAVEAADERPHFLIRAPPLWNHKTQTQHASNHKMQQHRSLRNTSHQPPVRLSSKYTAFHTAYSGTRRRHSGAPLTARLSWKCNARLTAYNSSR